MFNFFKTVLSSKNDVWSFNFTDLTLIFPPQEPLHVCLWLLYCISNFFTCSRQINVSTILLIFFYTSLVPWCPLPLCWGAKKETVLTLVFCFALYWLERVMMLTVFVDMQQEKQHSQMKHERFALFSRRKMRLVAWEIMHMLQLIFFLR